MAKLDIRIAPDPVLKRKADPVTTVDSGIRTLMDDMLETMYDAPGIGLAAPQVGVLKRVVVLDIADKDEPPDPMRLINPELVWTSAEARTHQEGCLSLPEQYADVTRPERCRIRYLDADGVSHELDAEGMLATCLQHELDHLDGILFTDHLSSLKRSMIMKKLAKWKKSRAA